MQRSSKSIVVALAVALVGVVEPAWAAVPNTTITSGPTRPTSGNNPCP